MLPTYVFSKPANDQWNYESIIPHVTPREKLFPVDELPRSGEAEFVKQREFRISPETLEEVRQVLKNFEGHKDFHNYTIAKGIIGKSSNRKIMTFEVKYFEPGFHYLLTIAKLTNALKIKTVL